MRILWPNFYSLVKYFSLFWSTKLKNTIKLVLFYFRSFDGSVFELGPNTKLCSLCEKSVTVKQRILSIGAISEVSIIRTAVSVINP